MDIALQKWRDVILKLQDAEEKIQKTQGYTKEVEAMRILKEMIKEQYPNENFDTATREIG